MSEPQKIAPELVDIGKALGRIPSGVFLLGLTDGPTTRAMLVSWVQQAAFTPPAIMLALGKERAARPLIEKAGSFAISILETSDKPFVARFVRPPQDPAQLFVG